MTLFLFSIISLEIILVATLISIQTNYPKLSILIKALASMCFVLLGYSQIQSSDSSMLIMYGLLSGAMGDILLAISLAYNEYSKHYFIFGAFLFFIGHIFYIVELIRLSHYVHVAFFLFFIASFILVFLLFNQIKLDLRYKLMGLLYIITVLFMATNGTINMITISGFKSKSFGIGSALFLISDILLIINRFVQENKWYQIFCLSFYYIGQSLLAMSI
ncbi:putative membrane protein [Lachnospiraceae bacterium JC7]|nr:putative membrane protein [Lachnospiraceae bacterium JC7]